MNIANPISCHHCKYSVNSSAWMNCNITPNSNLKLNCNLQNKHIIEFYSFIYLML